MPSFRIEEHDSTLWLENRGEAHDNKGLGGVGGGGAEGSEDWMHHLLSWVLSAELTYNQCVQHDSVVL